MPERQPKFSNEQLQYLGQFPDVVQRIQADQAKMAVEQKNEKNQQREIIKNNFQERQKQRETEYQKLISEMITIPNELKRYDTLTSHYLAIINNLPNFCQAAIQYFGEFPTDLSPKKITHLVDRSKTTAYASNYLKQLQTNNIITPDEAHKTYHILDPHFQNFLVMRYNPEFQQEIKKNPESRNSDTCISDFVKNNQEYFKNLSK